MAWISNTGGSEILSTSPHRPWVPPSLLCDKDRVSFLRVKRPGCGVGHQSPSSAEIKEKLELYLYSSSGLSWPLQGWTLPLPLPLNFFCSEHFRQYLYVLLKSLLFDQYSGCATHTLWSVIELISVINLVPTGLIHWT